MLKYLPNGKLSRRYKRRMLALAASVTLTGSFLAYCVHQFMVHDSYVFAYSNTDVKDYEALTTGYASEYGVSEYLPWLMSIMEVESGGSVDDVMQSSESLGLDPNSLDTDSSIEQGCSYFAQLLQKAKELGTDFDSVLQAYNYGSGYLDYVAAHGKVHTDELAEQFAKENANDKKCTDLNPVAIKSNGGWRYAYGNMFYVTLVHNAYTKLYGNIE